MKMYQFSGDEHEVSAAVALCNLAGVTVSLPSGSNFGERLAAAGFAPLPRAIDVSVRLPYELRRSNRSMRRSIEEARRAWSAADLQMSFGPRGAVGETELDALFDVIVRHLYAHGMSPFGIRNRESFDRLLTGDCWVALVRQGAWIVGGGLLRECRSHATGNLAGIAGEGRRVEGLVYAFEPAVAACRRAFIYELLQLASGEGFRQLSLGLDLPWFQIPYGRVLLEKVRWADAVQIVSGEGETWGHFANAGGDGIGYFALTEAGLDLRATADAAYQSILALCGPLRRLSDRSRNPEGTDRVNHAT